MGLCAREFSLIEITGDNKMLLEEGNQPNLNTISEEGGEGGRGGKQRENAKEKH